MESTHASAETHEMSHGVRCGQTPTPDQGFRGMSGWRVSHHRIVQGPLRNPHGQQSPGWGAVSRNHARVARSSELVWGAFVQFTS
jgi:hypothetical protein